MIHTPTSLPVETLEARLALKLAAALSESSAAVPHDISERLRTARENALRVRRPEGVVASGWQRSGNSAVLTGEPSKHRFSRLMVWLPLIILAVGLYLIRQEHGQSQVSAAADVDAVLLADDLPPDAYSDAGFLEFLKLPPP
ncbi:MAG: DUF3619 family protein [Pseudomonadota bacterium]